MRRIYNLLAAIFIAANIFAQVPQLLSYQAVIRNGSDQLVANKQVGMKISILQTSISGTAVYTETQTPTTNVNGLISIQIGGGTGFSNINWANGPYFIKTETDIAGGTNYTITGTSQLLSVPYALAAGSLVLANVNPKSVATYITDAGNYVAIPSISVQQPFDSIPNITDIDGNVYGTVKIGTQVWMTSNLKTTHFRNGDAIPSITDNIAWSTLTTGAQCTYNNTVNEDSINLYGRLYNFYAVANINNIAPLGWHVATDAEWTTLTTYLGTLAGGRLKEAGAVHWAIPNADALNDSKFNGLPCGYRSSNGTFNSITRESYWWSTAESNPINAWFRSQNYSSSVLNKSSQSKSSGLSVRCLKGEALSNVINTTPTIPTVSTMNSSSITTSNASCGGTISSDGGLPITSRGVCWSTSSNPTVADLTTNNGAGSGTYTSIMNSLLPNTVYYVRAYAKNSFGTAYGNEIIVKTISPAINLLDCKVWANYYSDNVYITSGSQLFKSIDSCKTWEYVSTLSFSNALQLEIYGDIMYATDQYKIYKSNNQGKSWSILPVLPESDRIQAYSVDNKTQDVYAATNLALFRFDGTIWSRIKTTTSDNSTISIAIDHDGNVYYDLYLYTIYKSIDKGANWSTLNYGTDGRSTTGAMYVTDDNTLLMNRWWNGVYKLSSNDCISLNNGLTGGAGTKQIVSKDEKYYTVLSNTSGILGIYYSANRGLLWNICNNNLEPYDMRNFVNMAMNKSGVVIISIKGAGCYKLNTALNKWELL